jgi:hypothetical protein
MRFVGLVASEHELGAHPARRDGGRGDAVHAHLLGDAEGQPRDRRFRGVVVEIAAQRQQERTMTAVPVAPRASGR